MSMYNTSVVAVSRFMCRCGLSMSATSLPNDRLLYVVTPLLESRALSSLTGYNVYLKLENLQPTGSFKCRGVSHMCKKAQQSGCRGLICASGGNAGLAAAYAGRQLDLPVYIILPTTTPQSVADILKNQWNATVLFQGGVWDEANEYAVQMAKEQDLQHIPPFDHPDIWEGNESLVIEMADQIPCRPDVVILSVGGGGLLSGVVQGMDKVGWRDVPIIAMETEGADCLNASVKAERIVTLPAITSLAICLGARTVCRQAFHYYSERKIVSELVTDKQAVEACCRFADDQRLIIEPACGASLAVLYSGLIPKLQQEGRLGAVHNVLVIVCGGANVNQDLMSKWKTEFKL